MRLRELEKDRKVEMDFEERKIIFSYYFTKNGRRMSPDRPRIDGNRIRCPLEGSKIDDRIIPSENSLEIKRNWKIVGEGKVKLSFMIQIPEKSNSWIIPSVNYNGNPKATVNFRDHDSTRDGASGRTGSVTLLAP